MVLYTAAIARHYLTRSSGNKGSSIEQHHELENIEAYMYVDGSGIINWILGGELIPRQMTVSMNNTI